VGSQAARRWFTLRSIACEVVAGQLNRVLTAGKFLSKSETRLRAVNPRFMREAIRLHSKMAWQQGRARRRGPAWHDYRQGWNCGLYARPDGARRSHGHPAGVPWPGNFSAGRVDISGVALPDVSGAIYWARANRFSTPARSDAAKLI
jgi:hypothetical protein